MNFFCTHSYRSFFFQSIAIRVSHLLENLHFLWNRSPAFFYGLIIVLNVSFTACLSYFLLCAIILLIGILGLAFYINSSIKQLVPLILFALASFFYGNIHFNYFKLPQKAAKGTALINITSLSLKKNFFGKNWVIKGNIVNFLPDVPLSKNIKILHAPVVIRLSENYERMPASQSYFIKGELIHTGPGFYLLKADRESPWVPLKNSWSLAEFRFTLKQKLADYIKRSYHFKDSFSFLKGVVTGEFDDLNLIFELSRFGLQHIMAISGFHFALLATFLNFIFGLIMPRRQAHVLLITFLTAYYFFLGPTSSVMRAWMSAIIALSSYFMEKQSSSLNTLGIVIIFMLLLDPYSCQNLGFQFSFMTTAAILLFFSPIDHILQKIFYKRSLKNVINMKILHQYGYFTLSLFRQALSLSIAVNIASLPLMLFYFHKYPILSLFFNFFFPFLVGLSILFFILGSLLHMSFPPLGKAIHYVNDYFTQFSLNFTSNIPQSLDFFLEAPHFPLGMLVIYFFFILLLGILLKENLEQKKISSQDFLLI